MTKLYCSQCDKICVSPVHRVQGETDHVEHRCGINSRLLAINPVGPIVTPDGCPQLGQQVYAAVMEVNKHIQLSPHRQQAFDAWYRLLQMITRLQRTVCQAAIAKCIRPSDNT